MPGPILYAKGRFMLLLLLLSLSLIKHHDQSEHSPLSIDMLTDGWYTALLSRLIYPYTENTISIY